MIHQIKNFYMIIFSRGAHWVDRDLPVNHQSNTSISRPTCLSLGEKQSRADRVRCALCALAPHPLLQSSEGGAVAEERRGGRGDVHSGRVGAAESDQADPTRRREERREEAAQGKGKGEKWRSCGGSTFGITKCPLSQLPN